MDEEADCIASEHVEVITENLRYSSKKMMNNVGLFLGGRTNPAYGGMKWTMTQRWLRNGLMWPPVL